MTDVMERATLCGRRSGKLYASRSSKAVPGSIPTFDPFVGVIDVAAAATFETQVRGRSAPTAGSTASGAPVGRTVVRRSPLCCYHRPIDDNSSGECQTGPVTGTSMFALPGCDALGFLPIAAAALPCATNKLVRRCRYSVHL